MAWQTPKTDWAIRYNENGEYVGDYFNVTDYNRIKGNLEHLAQQAALYAVAPTALDIPTIDVSMFCYVEPYNAVERAIDKLLATGVITTNTVATKTWLSNAYMPTAEDYNRIENACLEIYHWFQMLSQSTLQLPIRLGLREVENGT